MPIVSFINQKGGCGKSTTTCHFAYWLHQKGKEVAVIDSDAQQSVSRWLSGMDSTIQCFVMQHPDHLMDDIPKIAAKFEYVLIDGSAGITEGTRCILLRSDVVIIPVQPTGLDLTSASDAIRLVKQSQSVRNGLPRYYILLNRIVRGTRLYTEALQFLKDKRLLKTVIPQRQAIADCFGQKAVVWTLPPNEAVKEAGREFDALCQEMLETITP